MLQRLTGDDRAPLISGAIGFLMAAASAAFSRWRRGVEHLVIGQALVWLLVIIPVASGHHFVLLLWTVCVLMAQAAGPERPWAHWSARAALASVGAATLIGGLWEATRFYGPLTWASMGAWLALLVAIYDRSGSGQALPE